MPVVWMIPPELPPALSKPMLVQAAPQDPATTQVQAPDEVKVTAIDSPILDLVAKTVTYQGNVVAVYGPTTVYADKLVFNTETKTGEASGNVRLVDPEGTLRASYLQFNYVTRTGKALNAEVDAGGLVLTAESIDVQPNRWELINVTATPCEDRNIILLKSPRVVFEPGKQGSAYRPRVFLFGKHIITLPTRTFSLDRRNPGISFPGITYDKDDGLGITWSGGWLLDERTSLTSGFSVFKENYPGFGITLARSYLPVDKSDKPIPPRSELGERFNFSWFDNIRAEQPESTGQTLRTERNSIAVQTIFNTGTTARGSSLRYSKPLEVAYERGGKFGGFGINAQARAQFIEEQGDSTRFRTVFQASAASPIVPLGKNLFAELRGDAASFVGGGKSFAWVRSTAGVFARPVPQLTLGAAWIAGAEFGRPLYEIDELYAKNGFHLRGDLNLGPTKLAYMVKYDTERGWYDREYSISQIAGCIEPFLVYRQFPNTYSIGFRFRYNDFVSALQRREQRRTQPTTPTIISGPKHNHGGH